MKFIFGMILAILGLSLGAMFLPALIGIFIGLVKFDSGNILGGIIAIIIACITMISIRISASAIRAIFIYIVRGTGSAA